MRGHLDVRRLLHAFIPQFVVGTLACRGAYFPVPPRSAGLQRAISAGSTVLALGYLFPFTYLIHSIFHGKPAGNNPWGATGLEWTIPSPPITQNFGDHAHCDGNAVRVRPTHRAEADL